LIFAYKRTIHSILCEAFSVYAYTIMQSVYIYIKQTVLVYCSRPMHSYNRRRPWIHVYKLFAVYKSAGGYTV